MTSCEIFTFSVSSPTRLFKISRGGKPNKICFLVSLLLRVLAPLLQELPGTDLPDADFHPHGRLHR